MSDEPEFDERVRAAEKLLPAWFVPRMMTDEWHFALVLTNGSLLHVMGIDDVHVSVDGLWLDVRLAEEVPTWMERSLPGDNICAPTSRTRASVNARHVMVALETCDG
jgi:hypothetical protein